MKICEICEINKIFYKLTYFPTEEMKIYDNTINITEKKEEERFFCSNKCLKE
jgi:hypothetical protein